MYLDICSFEWCTEFLWNILMNNIRMKVTPNKNIKISSFKSSENIQKKEGGPDRSVSNY